MALGIWRERVESEGTSLTYHQRDKRHGGGGGPLQYCSPTNVAGWRAIQQGQAYALRYKLGHKDATSNYMV